uniref:Uncharacterized protein n=1 Tax=Parascaris univalens TaxID=6257 RepID=A0A914ZXH4_PARUN
MNEFLHEACVQVHKRYQKTNVRKFLSTFKMRSLLQAQYGDVNNARGSRTNQHMEPAEFTFTVSPILGGNASTVANTHTYKRRQLTTARQNCVSSAPIIEEACASSVQNIRHSCFNVFTRLNPCPPSALSRRSIVLVRDFPASVHSLLACNACFRDPVEQKVSPPYLRDSSRGLRKAYFATSYNTVANKYMPMKVSIGGRRWDT